MDWRLAGQAQSVVLEFLVDGQPVVPDASPIRFTAWDHVGLVIQSYDFEQPTGAIPTQMEVVLDAALGTIPAGALFETRYLRADFQYDSKPYFVQKTYRLHHMIPMTADTQTVRALVGADPEELPDSDIDMMTSYITLVGTLGASLDAALRRTDGIAMAANRAISLQAALLLFPSLRTRLLKSEKADNSAFQRQDTDFDQLEADLRAQLLNSLKEINDALSGIVTSAAGLDFFQLTSQTDRITGA